jgi:hypothetical protein
MLNIKRNLTSEVRFEVLFNIQNVQGTVFIRRDYSDLRLGKIVIYHDRFLPLFVIQSFFHSTKIDAVKKDSPNNFF